MVGVLSITETTAVIQWSFSSLIGQGGPETYTVLYGTSPDQLVMSTPSIPSDPNMQQYTQMLGSLQPGTMYYIEIQSRNVFTIRTTSDMTRFKTMDASEFATLLYNGVKATYFHSRRHLSGQYTCHYFCTRFWHPLYVAMFA